MTQEYPLDNKGFIDVPYITEEGEKKHFFPRLLDENIRTRDFPQIDENDRIYFDNGATTQEPVCVMDKIYEFRKHNIRGSNHSKNSKEAKETQERVDEEREKLQNFFGAREFCPIYTSGTTEASNLIATNFPLNNGDILILTEMEHSSQIVTARNIAGYNNAKVIYVDTDKETRLNLEELKEKAEYIKKYNKKGKVLMNVVHVSNFTGLINEVKEIREILGDDAYIYLDMAQSAGHIPINLDELDVNFAGFSGHKMYGPEGIGGAFVREDCIDMMKPIVSGGGAVELVSKHFTAYEKAPARFELGTQNMEGMFELGLVIDYLNNIGMKNVEKHDHEVGRYLWEELKKIKGVNLYGPKEYKENERTGVTSFNVGSWMRKNHANVARELDKRGISVRDGCFCAHRYVADTIGVPYIGNESRTILSKMGVGDDMLKYPGAVRAVPGIYNTINDAYELVEAVRDIADSTTGLNKLRI